MNQQTKQKHPGVVALEARIAEARKQLPYWENLSSDSEKALEEQIAVLQENLMAVRRHRMQREEEIKRRREDVEKLEKLKTLAEEDHRVAQAVWMKLLVERSKKV